MSSFPRLSLRFLAPIALAFALSSGEASARSARRVDDATPTDKVHVVGAGQTLAKIAKRYHVSVADLREVNDLAAGQKLHSGMRLVIPSKDRREETARDDRDEDDKKGKRKSKTKHARHDDRDRDDDDAGRGRDEREAEDERDAKPRKGAREVGTHDRHTGGVVKEGHLRLVHGSQTWEGKAFDKKGKLSAKAMDAFTRLLSSSSGKQHKIEPRLVSLVAIVSDHFGGRTIEVVSGFRPPTAGQFTAHSRHNAGAAIDMHVRGVDNAELRDFCKTLRNVGVGFYPNSSFVHMDVRDVATSWVDFSKPGEAPRYNRPDAAKDAEDQEPQADSTAPREEASNDAKPGDGSNSTRPAADVTR